MGFFTTDFQNQGYKAQSNASFQGQLSSSYEAALSAEVKALADYVGFIYSTQAGVTLEQAKAVVQAISTGQFQLVDLQSSAQSKTGAVDGSVIKDPEPKVVVNGVSISIKDMLGGLDTESWKDAGKNGQFHTREFYTSSHEPTGYHSDWADPPKPNEAPTATAIHVGATETQSNYDASHHLSNGDVDGHMSVNLLDGASDPDGDVLTTDGYQFFDKDHNPIGMPSYISIVEGKLIIDQNHRDLDVLKQGEHIKLSVAYDIDDGHGHSVPNTAYIDIEGTADIYQANSTGHVQAVIDPAQNTGGGNNNANVLNLTFNEQQDGGFDFHVTNGSLTLSSPNLTNREKINISDAGAVDGFDAQHLAQESTSATVALTEAALTDDQVDYNTTFVQTQDSLTVDVKYDYTYWHWA